MITVSRVKDGIIYLKGKTIKSGFIDIGGSMEIVFHKKYLKDELPDPDGREMISKKEFLNKDECNGICEALSSDDIDDYIAMLCFWVDEWLNVHEGVDEDMIEDSVPIN